MNRALLTIAALTTLGGCDYSGDWLFPEPTDEVPGIIDLGTIEPATVTTLDEIREAAIYGEIGATGRAVIGGATFNFVGTGSSVCLWVDPETVYWSQSVGRQGAVQAFAFPDNSEDDGDIDLYAGVSVYYSGSPGVEIGNFEVRYQDALGNEIPIEFNECVISSNRLASNAHSGKSVPEYCTLPATQLGVDYTVVLETFSPPADDDRLGYGLLVANGDCDDIQQIGIEASFDDDECLILGESIDPRHEHDYRDAPTLVTGYTAVQEYAWEDSVKFEGLYCAALGLQDEALYEYCIDESDLVVNREDCDRLEIRCFCGDITDSPTSDY